MVMSVLKMWTSTDIASPSWTKVTFNKTISLTKGNIYYLVLRPYDAFLMGATSGGPAPSTLIVTGCCTRARPGSKILAPTP